MIPIIIGVVALITGAGTTAVVADSAKPGDTLYGIDRAVENMRVAFTIRTEAKSELKVKLAEERLTEVKELIDESNEDDTKDDTDAEEEENEEEDSKKVGNLQTGLQHALNIITELSLERADNPGLANAVDRLLATMNERIGELPEDIDVRMDSNDLATDESGSVGRSEIRLNVEEDKMKLETRMNGERIRIEVNEDGELDMRVQEDRRGSNSGEEDRLDSELRGETRVRTESDGTLRIETDSGLTTSGKDPEEPVKMLERQTKELEDQLKKVQSGSDSSADDDDDADANQDPDDDSDEDADADEPDEEDDSSGSSN